MLQSIRTTRKILCSLVAAIVFVGVTSAPASAAWMYHVSNGDSLFNISQKVDVPLRSIQDANALKSASIHPGDKLVIPDEHGTDSAKGWNYRVRSGDSLYGIARKVDIDMSLLARVNGISGQNLRAGSTLTIPYSGPGFSGQAAPSSTSRGTTANVGDVEMLARLIHAEARGESFTGQVAVGAVIVNRVRSGKFPGSIGGVIYAPGEFETVSNGQINLAPDANAYRAAQAALSGWDPTGGALFFFNPAKTFSRWIWSRSIIVTIGAHVFAR